MSVRASPAHHGCTNPAYLFPAHRILGMRGVNPRIFTELILIHIYLPSDENRQKVTLSFSSLLEFDREIQRGYKTWVRDAPPVWKGDSFFVDRFPICVTSRYGQDQEIGNSANVEEESSNWYRDRDFSRVRFLNVAIATHLWYVSSEYARPNNHTHHPHNPILSPVFKGLSSGS